jgi:hypothetical protein
MKCNVGKTERIIRIIAGAGLVGWALKGGPVWAWIGVLPVITGFFRYCPAYSLFNISTDKKEH